MVGVLLDTCVLSELRRPQGNPQVRVQVDELDPAHLYLSVITLGELSKGVELLAASRQKRAIATWLLGLEQRFSNQILPIDADVARHWGQLTARAQSKGVQVPAADGLIAATALQFGLHVMTRNTKHFAATGAFIIDPWMDVSA